ncbi:MULTISPECIES: heme-binding protein [Halorussus]|uniref:SOUL family heme-binding protein n=1 Tax=Halorussus TaxID=1070314 RepID=UPI000E20CAAA|nr:MULTISPECIES: heme-binding protein [Halorussus]NHN60981.1 heme-binding protein [Halorussus sp. JP-T4]
MRDSIKALTAGAGGLLAAWVGWGLYVDRTTERVPYETVETFDGAELRRYPRTVLVETTADDQRTAFGRLFGYISGENAADEELSMTAPVATDADGGGTAVSMTAPVRTALSGGERVPMTAPVRTDSGSGAGGGSVTMAFYLPAEYSPGTAPTPTDPRVRLVVEPPRTLAVRSFSWYATDDRIERNLRDLRDALDARDLAARGRPVVLQYDDPWTPPFMRRNEVGVEVIDET